MKRRGGRSKINHSRMKKVSDIFLLAGSESGTRGETKAGKKREETVV